MSEVSGVVKVILPLEQGESSQGKSWQKRGFVVTTQGDYPKDIFFSTFGEKVALVNKLAVGNTVSVSYNLSSREYNGKYYTQADAWKVTSSSESSLQTQSQGKGDNNDLPF